MEREPTSPLFVRLPTASAEKLSRAAFELKTPKRELVTELVDRYLGDESAPTGSPSAGPDVLTVEQLAELLQVDAKTVRTLATSGDLPGRKLGRHWRFSRQAVLDWPPHAWRRQGALDGLATPERRKGAPGFQGFPSYPYSKKPAPLLRPSLPCRWSSS